MGQAKIRKLQGTYPKQTPKVQRLNLKDGGRAFALLYKQILDDLNERFPDQDGGEGKATAALTRMCELGATAGFALHEPLLLLVHWQDQSRRWTHWTTDEKKALAKMLYAGTGFPEPTRQAFRAHLAQVHVVVDGDSVTFGKGWM